jgi:hypothetical protein
MVEQTIPSRLPCPAPRGEGGPAPPVSRNHRNRKGPTMLLRNRPTRRRGVAAIELGFVTVLFVIPLIIGIWETGRLIHVQQVVANAAREGARLAGQGIVIKTDGSVLQIKKDSGSQNVKDAIVDYIRAAGLTQITASDVTVTFAFTTARTTNYNPIIGIDPAGTSYPVGSIPPEPCYGEKGQVFTVYVSIPWNKVRWINMGILQPNKVEFKVTWRMLIDDVFTVNETIPTW